MDKKPHKRKYFVGNKKLKNIKMYEDFDASSFDRNIETNEKFDITKSKTSIAGKLEGFSSKTDLDIGKLQIKITSWTDQASNDFATQDLKNLLAGKCEIFAEETKDGITVLITSTVGEPYAKGTPDEIIRHGRIFYIKDKIPVTSGYWMDWNESEVSDDKYKKLSKNDRAEIEAKNQFNYGIDKQYDEWFSTTYAKNKK